MSEAGSDSSISDGLRRLRGEQLRAVMSRLFGSLDGAFWDDVLARLEWMSMGGGEVLFEQGSTGDELYVVVSGRLRAVAVDGSDERVLNDVVRGQTVGEMALFTGRQRSARVFAVRDSVLVRISRDLFDHIIGHRPGAVVGITRLITERLAQLTRVERPAVGSNIALLPAAPDVPMRQFAGRLAGAIQRHHRVLRLDPEVVARQMDCPGIAEVEEATPDHHRMLAWLDERELETPFVIFQADATFSPWTRLAIRHADTVLIIASADRESPAPQVQAYVGDQWGGCEITTPELVLIHESDVIAPSRTGRWFDGQRSIRHHHVRWDRDADIQRLARFVTGDSVGLVLGGGGARGLAHVGVTRALRERGIPIDAVGGTSIGSLIAAGIAMGFDDDTLEARLREGFTRTNPLGDINVLPFNSVVKGRRLDAMLQEHCGERRIEDLWLDFFCVSSNLNDASMVVHRSGVLWKALRASASLPGVLPPVVDGKRLLIDGAIFNNLPIDIMAEAAVHRVIAVDVGVRREYEFDGDEVPSLWQHLKHRLLRPGTSFNAPHLMSVLIRATTLSSREKSDRMRADADLYLNPTITNVGLTDWKAFDAIVDQAYTYACQELDRQDLSFLIGDDV